ncbi:MAG: N-acetylmuramoyl-L-alanine amidase [Solirubrobacteraceae bacterium]
MRRLLVLLAAVGLAVWLAAPALSARPFVPQAVEFAQSIEAGAGEARAGAWRSRVIRAPKRFDLVGLSWRGAEHGEARIRVRDASSGAWGEWTAMADDHAGGAGAEPVWAGGADALQLRLRRVPRGLRAHFINATGSATAAQRRLTAVRRTAHDAFVALSGAPARAQSGGGAPAIVSREAWGAEQCGAPRDRPTYGSVQAGFVHHTVSANDYARQESAAVVRAICRYHRNTNGWRDIGYNFLVDRYGQIFEGRAGGIEQAVIGAQAQGYNGVSTGVANIGTFSGVAQTAAGVAATAELLAWKLTLHGAPVEGKVVVPSSGGPSNRYPAATAVTLQRISGHRDADRTSCPGDALYRQLPQIRQRAAQLAPAVAAAPPSGTVTLTAADRTLALPQVAQLAGSVTASSGAPLAGAPVSLQFATPGGFQTQVRAVSARDGTWSAQVATQYTRSVRAVAGMRDGSLVATSALLVKVAPRIGALAPKRVVAQRAFSVRGSVRPRRTALALMISREGSDGEFHAVARVALKTTAGRFSTTVRLRRAALHRLRVVSRSGERNLAGRSRDVYLRAVRQRR